MVTPASRPPRDQREWLYTHHVTFTRAGREGTVPCFVMIRRKAAWKKSRKFVHYAQEPSAQGLPVLERESELNPNSRSSATKANKQTKQSATLSPLAPVLNPLLCSVSLWSSHYQATSAILPHTTGSKSNSGPWEGRKGLGEEVQDCALDLRGESTILRPNNKI